MRRERVRRNFQQAGEIAGCEAMGSYLTSVRKASRRVDCERAASAKMASSDSIIPDLWKYSDQVNSISELWKGIYFQYSRNIV
jgi:hypothetical protein